MYTVKRSYRESSRGNIVAYGWDLFYNDSWCQKFWYKRDALKAAAEAMAA
jgi:hypothetical protein